MGIPSWVGEEERRLIPPLFLCETRVPHSIDTGYMPAVQKALFGPDSPVVPRKKRASPTPKTNSDGWHPKNKQLPLMATAREIRKGYQGWEGDRDQIFDNSLLEDGVPAASAYRSETDDEMFARKYEESHGDPAEYGHYATSPDSTNGRNQLWDVNNEEYRDSTPVTERLRNSNYHLNNPISLQLPNKRNRWEENNGKTGVFEWKPSVFGGHHRIAVMENEAPDRLMPVLHTKQFTDGPKLLGLRY